MAVGSDEGGMGWHVCCWVARHVGPTSSASMSGMLSQHSHTHSCPTSYCVYRAGFCLLLQLIYRLWPNKQVRLVVMSSAMAANK